MSTIAAPIDVTATPEWAALQAHHDELVASGFSLKEAFATDPGRVEDLSFETSDLHFDLSKNLVTKKTVELLCDLARAVGLEERRDAMYSGAHINTTEDRAVLHTALRRPAADAGTVFDGEQLRRVEGRHGQAHRARDVHRHRRLRPRPRHGLRGAEAPGRRRD